MKDQSTNTVKKTWKRNTSGLIPWRSGKSGNELGRPKGLTSPQIAKKAIMDLFKENEDNFEEALRELISEKGILYYYRNYVFPLMPKNIELSGEVEVSKVDISKKDVDDRIIEIGSQLKEINNGNKAKAKDN